MESSSSSIAEVILAALLFGYAGEASMPKNLRIRRSDEAVWPLPMSEPVPPLPPSPENLETIQLGAGQLGGPCGPFRTLPAAVECAGQASSYQC